ncbi:MAG: hypothetical protein HZB16_03775 [Armatimonadetes bacterium]|nr:hypothetical protein [Armatimonadota bacterium]
MPQGASSTPYPPGLLQDWFATHVFCPLHGVAFVAAIIATVVAFVAILAGLQSLGSGARRRLTMACTFVAGLFYLLAFVLTPGNKASGTAVIGGKACAFRADITWDTAPDPTPQGPPVDDKDKPWQPPKPKTRTLKGAVELTPAEKVKGEPQPGVDILPIEGTQNADGTWDLKLAVDETPVALTRTGRSYALAWTGGSGTLTFRAGIPLNRVKGYEQPLGTFMIIMGGFTIFLGLINLVMLHGKVLLGARRGWHNSLAFFIGLVGMTVFGLWQLQLPALEAGQPVPLAHAGYKLFFDGLLKPLQSTTFALLGFFIVSAAYRAFRIRSTEAALMTIVAFVVMLGQVPMGQALTAWIPADGPFGWLRIETITNWLLTTPNTAATRGILFGSVTGGFALSLRVWLSLERGSYFGKEF